MKFEQKEMLRHFPAFVRNDFGRKMVALVLAAIVYFVVRDRIGSEREIQNIPVQIPTPSTLVTIEDKPQKIKIRVQGSESIVKNLTENNFEVADLKVDESKFIPGESYKISVSPGNVRAPLGVRVVSVDPQVLLVDYDRLETKNLKVKAVFSAKEPLASGYSVGRTIISPAEVLVTAPSAAISRISELQTKPISLEGITQTFDYYAEVAAPLPGLKISPPKVLVQVEIIKNIDDMTFSGLPIRILANDRKNLKAELLGPSGASVTLTAPREILATLRKQNVKPYIDLAELDRPGIYNVDVDCWISNPAANVKTIQPANVKVKLSTP